MEQKKNSALQGARKSLMRGRVRHLGPVEALGLKLAGRIDGGRGLPRQLGTNGPWSSPHLQREVHAYEEACAKAWGGLQLLEEETYADLHQLEDKLTEARREAAGVQVPALTQDKPERRWGEDGLSDAQVAARRAAEHRRRTEPVRARAAALEEQQRRLREERSALESRLVEERHCVQLVSRRLSEHMAQRVAAYWNAVLVSHPQREDLPPSITVPMTSHAEELYVNQHSGVLEPLYEEKEVE